MLVSFLNEQTIESNYTSEKQTFGTRSRRRDQERGTHKWLVYFYLTVMFKEFLPFDLSMEW